MQIFSNKYISEKDAFNSCILGLEFEFYCDYAYNTLLYKLNRELSPVKVWGFRQYHSDMKPDENNFKIEMDLSGGANLIELVTGPLPYYNMKIYITKILKFLQDYCKTTNTCGIHVNISFDENKTDKKIEDINVIKSILYIDEDYIYKLFPDRKNNFYAKSVKKMIPYKTFDFTTNASNVLLQNIELSSDDTRYYGINLKNVYNNKRLEYRYIGGENYQYKSKDVLELIDYFILFTWNNINKEFTSDDINMLQSYLSKNINNYKKFTSYEDFIGEFPSIQLEINKDNSPMMIKSYYGEIYDNLYDIIMNIYNLGNCIINYDTMTKKIEVVDAVFRTILNLKNVRLIDCDITDGDFENCEFINSDIKNSHLYNSKVMRTDIFNSKLNNCNVDMNCTLEEVYFNGGFLDGEMKSGIIRSARIGSEAVIDDKVKILSDEKSYFGVKFKGVDKDDDKSKKDFDKNDMTKPK
jgi:hypothetical protein